MVIGDGAAANQQVPPSQFGGASIDNIMSGIENTGTVKMNNHRKKLRQRFDIIKKLGQGKSLNRHFFYRVIIWIKEFAYKRIREKFC